MGGSLETERAEEKVFCSIGQFPLNNSRAIIENLGKSAAAVLQHHMFVRLLNRHSDDAKAGGTGVYKLRDADPLRFHSDEG